MRAGWEGFIMSGFAVSFCRRSLLYLHICVLIYLIFCSNFAKYGQNCMDQNSQNPSNLTEFKKKKNTFAHHPVTMVLWVIPWKILIFVSAPWDLLERWTAISALGDGEDLPSPTQWGGEEVAENHGGKTYVCYIHVKYHFTNIVDMYTVNIDIYIYIYRER